MKIMSYIMDCNTFTLYKYVPSFTVERDPYRASKNTNSKNKNLSYKI